MRGPTFLTYRKAPKMAITEDGITLFGTELKRGSREVTETINLRPVRKELEPVAGKISGMINRDRDNNRDISHLYLSHRVLLALIVEKFVPESCLLNTWDRNMLVCKIRFREQEFPVWVFAEGSKPFHYATFTEKGEIISQEPQENPARLKINSQKVVAIPDYLRVR